MTSTAIEWLSLAPELFAVMVGIGLALAWREHDPRAAGLLIAGLVIQSAAPLATAALQSFWMIGSPPGVGAVLFGLRLVGAVGTLLGIAAAAVGRPARDPEDEP